MAAAGKSYWIRSGFFSILERLSMIIFSFGAFIFVVRLYPMEIYGYWVLFLSATSFLEMARNGLIQNGLIKFLTVAESKSEEGKISTASLALNAMLTFFAVLLLIALAKPLSVLWDAPMIVNLFLIYTITTVIILFQVHINFVQNANLNFKGPMVSNILRSGIYFILMAWVYFSVKFKGMELPPLEWLAGFQILGAIGGVIGTYLTGKKYLVFSKKIDWDWVKKLFSYGKYVFGTNLSTMLYKNTDRWMLGAMLSGSGAVALYDVCIKINNLLEVPTQSIAQVVFPQGAKTAATGTKKEIKELYERAVGGILALVIPASIVVLLFPSQILRIIAGHEYMDAVNLLIVTVFFALIFPFNNQFGTILDSIGRPKINFYFVVCSATLNVILNYFFISKYGLMGAAYATLLSYGITFVVDQIILYKMFGTKPWNAFVYIPKFYVIGWKYVKDYLKKDNTSKTGNLRSKITENTIDN